MTVGIDSPTKMNEVKNCRTCVHCKISGTAPSLDYCLLGSTYCDMQRRFPTRLCDSGLSGWAPRSAVQIAMDNKFLIVVVLGLSIILVSSLLNNLP